VPVIIRSLHQLIIQVQGFPIKISLIEIEHTYSLRYEKRNMRFPRVS
jgi:hypothetical protein